MSKPIVPGWALTTTASDQIRELDIDLEEVRDLMAHPLRVLPGKGRTRKYVSEVLEAYVNLESSVIIHLRKRGQVQPTAEQQEHLSELRAMDDERGRAQRLAEREPFVLFNPSRVRVRPKFGPVTVRRIGDEEDDQQPD